jgi:ATP-dependent helicase/nuclease subunit B
MDAIAESHHAQATLRSLMSRIGELMAAHEAHPARTVVLWPFIHLLQPARQAWAAQVPSGFAPRFETTQTWSGARGHAPAPEDFSSDMARDLLAARVWLERVGLGERAQLLAGRLVEAAAQLAPAAAAMPSALRREWATKARSVITRGLEAPMLSLEAAIAQVAIEWVAATSFATDALLEGPQATDLDLLVVVEGLQAEPLARAVAARLPGKVEALRLDAPAPWGRVLLHETAGPAEEAERAAACVLRHLEAGRAPVALAAIDRVLTRRIRAMLDQAGAAIRDETGWTLSTTRAAAHVGVALRACVWNAGADAVIDWMKNSPSLGSLSVLALERRIRRAAIREWRAFRADDLGDAQTALVEQVNGWRDSMQPARPLMRWLGDLRGVLQATGQWTWLERDAAGVPVIEALKLQEDRHEDLAQSLLAARRWTLAEFTAWVTDTLESRSFVPPAADDAQVVILPLHQLLGRQFAALVMPGCDEARLPAAPEPSGMWTAAQRQLLGLPTREALEAETRAAWRHALQTPHCDVLWRRGDEAGEPLLASTLVQSLQHEGSAQDGADMREERTLDPLPTPRPGAIGSPLPVDQVSASAYEDLRRCPYRFFASRMLGLQEPDELDTELDKRDFGNWLHQVLREFHESLAADWLPPGAGRVERMNEIAAQVSSELRLDDGEFLPFHSAWPQARDGYLAWLAEHESREGAQFQEAEAERERRLGSIKLVGRLDRIDRLRDGRLMVMDYKTESKLTTQDRVRDPAEDTQLAFYAALVGGDLRAAYINVGERGETKTIEQPDVAQARDLLVQGIEGELARIAAGEPLPALGEGQVCEWCSARGLCRKDFWE